MVGDHGTKKKKNCMSLLTGTEPSTTGAAGATEARRDPRRRLELMPLDIETGTKTARAEGRQERSCYFH